MVSSAESSEHPDLGGPRGAVQNAFVTVRSDVPPDANKELPASPVADVGAGFVDGANDHTEISDVADQKAGSPRSPEGPKSPQDRLGAAGEERAGSSDSRQRAVEELESSSSEADFDSESDFELEPIHPVTRLPERLEVEIPDRQDGGAEFANPPRQAPRPAGTLSPRNQRPISPIHAQLNKCPYHHESAAEIYDSFYRCMMCERCKNFLGARNVVTARGAGVPAVVTAKHIQKSEQLLAELPAVQKRYLDRLNEVEQELDTCRKQKARFSGAMELVSKTREDIRVRLRKLYQKVPLLNVKTMIDNMEEFMEIDAQVGHELDHINTRFDQLSILSKTLKIVSSLVEGKRKQMEFISKLECGQTFVSSFHILLLSKLVEDDGMGGPTPEPPEILPDEMIKPPSMMDLLSEARATIAELEEGAKCLRRGPQLQTVDHLFKTAEFQNLCTMAANANTPVETRPVSVRAESRDLEGIPATVENAICFEGAETLAEVRELLEAPLSRSGPLQYSHAVVLDAEIEPAEDIVAAVSQNGVLAYYGRRGENHFMHLVDLFSRGTRSFDLDSGPFSVGFVGSKLLLLPVDRTGGFSADIERLFEDPKFETLGCPREVKPCSTVQADELARYAGFLVFGNGRDHSLATFDGKKSSDAAKLPEGTEFGWRPVPTGVVGQTKTRRLCIDGNKIKVLNIQTGEQTRVCEGFYDPVLLVPSTKAPGDLRQGVLAADGIWCDLRSNSALELAPTVLPASADSVVRVCQDVFLLYDVLAARWVFIRLRVD